MCVCAGCLSDALHGWRELDFAPSPGLVPALVWAVQSRGHRLGAWGGLSLSLHQSGWAGTSGELFLCILHMPQDGWKCPNSCFYWPWNWANALREKPLQIHFFVFPFSPCILGGTWGDLKALSLPRPSQRSTGSTLTHQGPSATAL